MVADVEQVVCSVEMIPAAERHKLLVEWNATEAPYPQDRCIHELFEEQVLRTPEAIALQSGNENMSYGELNIRANQLARHLQTHGIGPEEPVAVCMERGFALIVGMLGVLKAGGVYLPLDPAYPYESLRYMLTSSRVRVILTQTALKRVYSTLPETDTSTALIIVDHEATRALIERQSEMDIPRETLGLSPGNLAYISYTYGPAGTPKAVGNSVRGLMNSTIWLIRTLPTESPVTA